MPVSTGQPGVRHSESRVVAAFPQFNGPEKGCNGWTIAKNPTGSPRAPEDFRPDVLSNPSSAEGAFTGQPGMSQAMEVDLVGGAMFATSNTQNFVLSQTNILNESCVFGNVSNQAIANHTAVAVGATIQVAEERHSVVVANHYSELEQASLVIRHFQELALRQQGQAAAHSAQADRLREIEIAFDIQNNEIATMKRERDATALAAQARACAWAAAHPSSSSGEGNQFHEPSSEGSAGQPAPVQPGRLESLAHIQDSVGYVKGSPSEPTTTCETAVGHGGSESSASDNRFLFPIDLTSRLHDKSVSRPLSPVNSALSAGTEQSGPRHTSLTTTQTITAPTQTVSGATRMSSPDPPGASSSSKDHANRKDDRKDKKDKKKKDDDDDDDKDKDEGRSKRRPTGPPGGGKKDPDDSDGSEGSKDPPPPPSDHTYPEVWEDGFGEGIDRYRSRTPRA